MGSVNHHTGGLEKLKKGEAWQSTCEPPYRWLRKFQIYCHSFRINVNHHTGGLEKLGIVASVGNFVNHHTGGLETQHQFDDDIPFVNHHTGGLEKKPGLRIEYSICEPPYRWLRKNSDSNSIN